MITFFIMAISLSSKVYALDLMDNIFLFNLDLFAILIAYFYLQDCIQTIHPKNFRLILPSRSYPNLVEQR